MGERVWAAWRKGRDYYAGAIISVHEAARTCTVAYDDDRSIEEDTLPFDMVRRPPPSVALAVGAEVEATGTANAGRTPTGTRRPSPRGTPTGPTTSRTSTAVIPRTYLRIGSGAGERRQTFLICGLSTRRPVQLRIRLVMETLRTRSHIPRTRSHIPRTRSRARNAAAHLPTARSQTIRDVAACSALVAGPPPALLTVLLIIFCIVSARYCFETPTSRARGTLRIASICWLCFPTWAPFLYVRYL